MHIDSMPAQGHARVMSKSLPSSSVDLSVNLAGLKLANPIMTASGTSGYGPEHGELMDLTRLGAFVTKAVSPEVRKGNPPERIVETPSGMLNAIGLANVGLERFVEEKVPFLEKVGIPIIVNVVGHRVEDYAAKVQTLEEEAIAVGESDKEQPHTPTP